MTTRRYDALSATTVSGTTLCSTNVSATNYYGINLSATNLTAVNLNVTNTAISASQLSIKIPILVGDTWTDNSPSSNYIAWNSHNLYYDGTAYSISASSTNLKYIYWLNGNSYYTASNTNPTLTDDDFVIATNLSGAHDKVLNVIGNQEVSTAYLENFAISRGAQFYSAGPFSMSGTTEVEIGTITTYTNTVTDSIWLWAECELIEHPEGGSGKEALWYEFILKIRRDSLSGTTISSHVMNPYIGGATMVPGVPPVVLIGTDVPGGSVGAHVYKFSVVSDHGTGGAPYGKVGYVTLEGFAKSR